MTDDNATKPARNARNRRYGRPLPRRREVVPITRDRSKASDGLPPGNARQPQESRRLRSSRFPGRRSRTFVERRTGVATSYCMRVNGRSTAKPCARAIVNPGGVSKRNVDGAASARGANRVCDQRERDAGIGGNHRSDLRRRAPGPLKRHARSVRRLLRDQRSFGQILAQAI